MSHTPTSHIMIVFALELEAQGRFDRFSPIFTGIGKVNAAYKLMQALSHWREEHGHLPALVLNLGSAGSPFFPKGSLVNCTKFVQRDFDVTALGIAPYTTPFEDTSAILNGGIRFAEYSEGVCGTGDSFATMGNSSSWNVMDMEAYALAKICYLEKIAFGCLKYISDGADESAAQSWESQLPDTAHKLHAAMIKLTAKT